MTIYEKINNLRADFHKAPMKKSGKNAFANYYYFELADIIPVAVELCQKHGLTPIISFEKERAVMTVYSGAESIVIESPMSEANLKGCHPVQNLGAVQTYIRRYLWTAFLDIVENDILDATTGDDKHEPKRKSSPPQTLDMVKKLRDDINVYVADNGVTKEMFTGLLKKKYAEMNEQELIDFYELLKNEVKK